MYKTSVIIIILSFLSACFSDDEPLKGSAQISSKIMRKSWDEAPVAGFKADSLNFETRPSNIILTKNKEHRLTPIYKVNYMRNRKVTFIGSTHAHSTLYDKSNEIEGNNWNNNFMPGFAAVYGYNLINISHYNNAVKTEKRFFDRPVLINTLYFPAFSQDTLNNEPVTRRFYMVSAYDEDTNKDGFVNYKDLRRMYLFDIDGNKQKALVPKNYYVMSSEYDPVNDFMYIVARKDKNKNGQMELNEPTDIFWIDLKNPNKGGKQYDGDFMN